MVLKVKTSTNCRTFRGAASVEMQNRMKGETTELQRKVLLSSDSFSVPYRVLAGLIERLRSNTVRSHSSRLRTHPALRTHHASPTSSHPTNGYTTHTPIPNKHPNPPALTALRAIRHSALVPHAAAAHHDHDERNERTTNDTTKPRTRSDSSARRRHPTNDHTP